MNIASQLEKVRIFFTDDWFLSNGSPGRNGYPEIPNIKGKQVGRLFFPCFPLRGFEKYRLNRQRSKNQRGKKNGNI